MTELLHKPVLESEVLEAFAGQPRDPQKILEGTFGRGGHTRAVLKKFPRSAVWSFDRDEAAHIFAQDHFAAEIKAGRFHFVKDDFRKLAEHDLGLFDGALFDLGVSSPQFDEASRGFSFMHDGPLDMRMDQSQSLTAAEIINTSSEKELSDLFFNLGEVRHPNRVVRAIVHDRKEKPYSTTRELASMIERVDKGPAGRARKGHHPATNYFMALRIAVNEELESLAEFIESMPLFLEPGSRLVVISFHSLEDRLVKWAFRRMHKKVGTIITKHVVTASDEELEINPRSRSAKLRIFEMGGLK